MLSIGFGLILYHVLVILIFIFLVIPFIMNLIDGKGYWFNVNKVWQGFTWVFRKGFGKREENKIG